MRIFRLDDFAPLIGAEFRILHPSGNRIVRLTEAKAIGHSVERGGRPVSRAGGSFFLYFEGAIAERFDQGLFGMEHDQLGAFDIFLVPIKELEGRRVYEAVFN